jgi:hypothetical protein
VTAHWWGAGYAVAFSVAFVGYFLSPGWALAGTFGSIVTSAGYLALELTRWRP